VTTPGWPGYACGQGQPDGVPGSPRRIQKKRHVVCLGNHGRRPAHAAIEAGRGPGRRGVGLWRVGRRDAECVQGQITPRKHGSVGTIAMVEPLRDRLLALPRESEWVFTTRRGHRFVPSTRSHHWNRVRCFIGLGATSLYEATSHYFAWYLLSVAELPDHVVAAQLRHTDGGTLVRELYGPRTRRWRASEYGRVPPVRAGRRLAGPARRRGRRESRNETRPRAIAVVEPNLSCLARFCDESARASTRAASV
jgi:hypothetical protein